MDRTGLTSGHLLKCKFGFRLSMYMHAPSPFWYPLLSSRVIISRLGRQDQMETAKTKRNHTSGAHTQILSPRCWRVSSVENGTLRVRCVQLALCRDIISRGSRTPILQILNIESWSSLVQQHEKDLSSYSASSAVSRHVSTGHPTHL